MINIIMQLLNILLSLLIKDIGIILNDSIRNGKIKPCLTSLKLHCIIDISIQKK